MAIINLKLPDSLHIKFHETTKNNDTTMQGVLSAFVYSYIDNPNKFIIKMGVSDVGSNVGDSVGNCSNSGVCGKIKAVKKKRDS